MRVSLEIEPLDLTPRSVLDFSALASPHAVRAFACLLAKAGRRVREGRSAFFLDSIGLGCMMGCGKYLCQVCVTVER